jgi:nucleoside-diphosphate-sugar epimerase
VGYFKILTLGEPGAAYNIGVDTPEISVAELAERVVQTARELWNYQGKVIRQVSPDENYLVDNPNRRCPQITKARHDLGYNPTISLEIGLKRSLIWYDGNRAGGDA